MLHYTQDCGLEAAESKFNKCHQSHNASSQ